MKIFVNCSNHPSAKWSAAQREAAEQYGKIVDIPFPAVACDLTDMQLEELAQQTAAEILAKKPAAVMCMGEFVVCFRIVRNQGTGKLFGKTYCGACGKRRHSTQRSSICFSGIQRILKENRRKSHETGITGAAGSGNV